MEVKVGNDSLKILRLHLAKHEIICDPFIDFIEGRLSAYIFTPNIFISGSSLFKFKYKTVN